MRNGMLLTWYIGFLTRPVETIRDVVQAKPLWQGLATLFVMMLMSQLFRLSGAGAYFPQIRLDDVVLPEVTIGLVVTAAIIIAVYSIPVYALLAFIPHLFARVLGGTAGSYTSYLAAASLTTIVMLVGAVAAGIIGLILTALFDNEDVASVVFASVSLAASIWVIVLWFFVLRENYQLTNGRTAITAVASAVAGAFAFATVSSLLLLILSLILFAFGLEIET